jgi:hypothetical protein
MVGMQPNTSDASPDDEVFLTAVQISKRWAGCHPKTAYNRLIRAGFKAVRFNSRTTLFRLSDVKSIERAGVTMVGQEIGGP